MALTRVAAAGINTGQTFVLQNVNTSGIVTAGPVQVGTATTKHTAGIDLGGGNITSHNINSTGIITATGGFVGAVTGNVTGNLTGNVTGDLTGDVTGNVTGNVSSSGANTLGSLSVTNNATVGGALTVTGDFTVNGTTTTIDTIVTAVDSLAVDGNVTAGGNLDITGVSTFKGTTEVKNSSFRVTNSGASGQYLQVTQNSNSSLNLDKVGDGAFYIRGNNIYLQNDGNSETYAGFEANGKSYLNYDGSTKLETTGAGVTITGDARVTGILTVGQNSTTINGAHEYPSIRPTLDLNFAATKTLDRRITFTRDSLGTYTDELGIIRTAPNNTPRFDHDPVTGESLGLLIEESRTNLFLESEAFNTWDNVRSSESVTTATADPEGNTTGAAYKLVANTDNNTHRLDKSGFSMSVSTTYTMSLWAKAAEYTGVSLTIADSSNASNGIYFDLSNGTLTTGGNAHSGSMIAYPNGWYRCIATYTTPASISFQQCLIGVLEDGTTKSYAGDNSSGIYIWGAQLEQGSFPTSYIPTSGSTVTRAADLAKITGTNFTGFYNDTEGTLFIHADKSESSNDMGVTINNMSSVSDNRIELRLTGSNTSTTRHVINSGGTGYMDSTTNIIDVNRYSFAFARNNAIPCTNGTLGTLDTVVEMPVGVSQMTIGSTPAFSGDSTTRIRQVSYYNKRLPNAQLQGLTAQ